MSKMKEFEALTTLGHTNYMYLGGCHSNCARPACRCLLLTFNTYEVTSTGFIPRLFLLLLRLLHCTAT